MARTAKPGRTQGKSTEGTSDRPYAERAFQAFADKPVANGVPPAEIIHALTDAAARYASAITSTFDRTPSGDYGSKSRRGAVVARCWVRLTHAVTWAREWVFARWGLPPGAHDDIDKLPLIAREQMDLLDALLRRTGVEYRHSLDEARATARRIIDKRAVRAGFPLLHDERNAEFARVVSATALERLERAASEIARWRSNKSFDLITQVKAAELVPCSEDTIQRRIEDGTLTGYSDGKVSRTEVETKRGSVLKRQPRKRKPRSGK